MARVVTRKTIQESARLAGLELTDQRADELVPQLQAMLDGLESLRDLVEPTTIEPALVFHALEEETHGEQ